MLESKDEKVILFTIPDCPKCKNLKMQLNNAKIEYELHEMSDEEVVEMVEKGFRSAPILKVGASMLTLKDAIRWVKENGNAA